MDDEVIDLLSDDEDSKEIVSIHCKTSIGGKSTTLL